MEPHVRRGGGSNREDRGFQRLGGVLDGVVARLGLRRDLDDYRVFDAWGRIVGPHIARNAQPTRLDARRLVVSVKSAVWMQELSLLREDIRRKLNESMGREMISEVFLVLGAPPEDGAATKPRAKRSRPPARSR